MKRKLATKKTAKKMTKRSKRYTPVKHIETYFSGSNFIINFLARSGAVKGGNQSAMRMMEHNHVLY